jgi:hypothetical protein
VRTEQVEIYSDATNAAVMRHPGRNFPGMLVQGDTLARLCKMASAALAGAKPESEQWHDLKELADELQWRVDFYAQVLREHNIQLPIFGQRE